MNNDYLWDRSGEPDPEIQQLEEVLGTLRYQPRPLELPSEIRPERRRRYLAPLAIAAAIALMILAAGLWIRIHRSQTGQGELAKEQPPVSGEQNKQPVVAASPAPVPGNRRVAAQERAPEEPSHIKRQRLTSPRNSLALNGNRVRDVVIHAGGLTAQQRDEALEAKEQLMLALRVASAKLNLAQRKIQSPAPGTIRNQHKVG